MGPINNLCVLTQIAPTYAETEEQLISVSVLDHRSFMEETIVIDVQSQLQEWFGTQVQDWNYIRTYSINAAQPEMLPPFQDPASRPLHYHDRLFVCGDFCATGTIDGALYSGRRAAEEIQHRLSA